MLRYLVYLLVALSGSAMLAGWMHQEETALSAPASDTVALGRSVYIAEGCIHCHSQYVRPIEKDRALWGPETSVERAMAQEPVLIGNRRQGPDLANVALRRPREWNRLHLIDPQSLMPGSRMPAYRYLFEPNNERGEALLVYLASLKSLALRKSTNSLENNESFIGRR
jgi:cytochrome c oxidase cbb3-type subunit 2